MIGALRGVVLDRAETEVTIDVAGVGYRVSMTPRDAVVTGEVGTEVFVWIHHHRRDDAELLYGFGSRDERDVFETLITTHGVGPALGLAILSVHTPGALRLAVATDDLGAMCLVPGVGKKTAARLLMELKSRLEVGDIDLTRPTATVDGTTTAPISAHGDVREALLGLGYGTDEIAAVLRNLPTEGDTGDLLRRALQSLAVA